MTRNSIGAARVLGVAGIALLACGVSRAVRADSAAGAAIAQKGIAAAGVPSCSLCHGPGGEGVASVGPRLAGLSKAYILNQLAAFRTGARKNAVMQPVAAALTPAQSEDLGDYFSAASAPSRPVPAAADLLKAGQRLAERGRWPDGLPSCENCHAPQGIGVAPDFPYLAGQQADYIERQIQGWRAGRRGGDPLGLMKAVSSKLSDGDIAAVAAYYASLSAPKRQGEN